MVSLAHDMVRPSLGLVGWVTVVSLSPLDLVRKDGGLVVEGNGLVLDEDVLVVEDPAVVLEDPFLFIRASVLGRHAPGLVVEDQDGCLKQPAGSLKQLAG